MERHPVRDELFARAFHPPQVYQQVMSGKPRFSGAQAALEYFDVPDAATRSRAYGDRKQSMVIELCGRLRLAQLQLRGRRCLAGRHREPSLGRVARWPRRAARRPGEDGRHVRHREGRPEGAGLLGEGMEFEEAWEQLGHITMQGAEAIKQIGGALPKRTERGLLGPDELPSLRYLYEVVVLERPVDIPWESFFGAASTPRVPRRADRRDARSGGRSPLARSVT